MADEEMKGGMSDCMPCPHCGKDIYLSKTGDGEGMHNEEEESFEDALRKHMSPQNPGNEGDSY